MKSAYELAMERLRAGEAEPSAPITAEQKTELAQVDEVYRAKIAEREIFLKRQLEETLQSGNWEEAEKIRQQIAAERTRLEEEREAAKNRVRGKS